MEQGCLQALLTAEPATLVGWVCELGASFTGAGGFAQGVRDGAIAYVNFAQSKKDRAAYQQLMIDGSLAALEAFAPFITKHINSAG